VRLHGEGPAYRRRGGASPKVLKDGP
jgi:hypothetical protein